MKETLVRARAKAKPAAKAPAKSKAKPAVTSSLPRPTQKAKPAAKSRTVKTPAAPQVGSTPKERTAKRATTKTSATKTASAKKPAVAKPAASGAPAGALTPKRTPAKKTVPAKAATKSASVKSAPAAPEKLRATKKRAPKDLALQYGEKEKTARRVVAPKAPRKRRDAAARERLQQVMAPDEALLQRLARAGAISSSLVPGSDDAKPVRVGKTRRSRYWQAHCGKCGLSARYKSSAALCAGCGTILVRE